MKSIRGRSWSITVNNWTAKEWYTLTHHKYIEAWKDIQLKSDYVIIGYEKGEKCGTRHLQVYLYVKNKISLSTIKEKLPRAHIELCKGSHAQNVAYCTKVKDGGIGFYDEFGEAPVQGKRNDLDDVRKLIDKEKSMVPVAQQYFGQYIRYHRGFEKYLSLVQTQRSEAPKVLWFYGSTGTGKSRLAFELGKGSVYSKDHTQWWDGYTQQKIIVVDDFDGRWPFRDLLKVTDRYPYPVQYKGGYVHLNSPYIIFTADRTPQEVYGDHKQHEIDQWMRRITKVVKFPPSEEDRNFIEKLFS